MVDKISVHCTQWAWNGGSFWLPIITKTL